MNITHELKAPTKFFSALFVGLKTFEIRKNDRNYKLGDILILRDYDEVKEQYREGYIVATVSYILEGGTDGLEEGYVCMGFDIIKKVDSIRLPF